MAGFWDFRINPTIGAMAPKETRRNFRMAEQTNSAKEAKMLMRNVRIYTGCLRLSRTVSKDSSFFITVLELQAGYRVWL